MIPGLVDLLEMNLHGSRARLVALDVADTEPPANQVVQPGAAHGQLPSRRAGSKLRSLDDVLLDERQRLSRLGRLAVMAIALEPLPASA